MSVTARVQVGASASMLAALIWTELLWRPEGLSKSEIEKLLGFNRAQTDRGLHEINHLLQVVRQRPLMVSTVRGRGAVYRLPKEYGDLRDFLTRRIRDIASRSHAELSRLEAALGLWPDALRPELPKSLRRILEDLRDLIGELDGG